MKSKIRLIIYLFLFACLIAAFIYIGKKDFGSIQKYSNSERFANEYNVSTKNNFKYAYGSTIIESIKNKKETSIIFLGFSSNEWSKYYVKYLMEVLDSHKVEHCYYYDILKDRAKSTKYYRELESMLSNYLYKNDTGITTIYTPALIIVKNGEIVAYDDETAIQKNNISPVNYWTIEKIYNFKNKINSYLEGVN